MRLLFRVIAGTAVCKMMLIPSAELLKQQKSHLLKFKEPKIVTERTLHCTKKELQYLKDRNTNRKHVIFAASYKNI